MKKLLSITLLAVLLLGLLSCGQKELPNADLTITFMETGKSDAILIKHKGTNILIDTGYAANAHEIENTLSREGVEKIDYMILTHYDKDHIGSAPTLMHTYEIGMIYAPDFVVETNEYASLMTTIQQMEIPLTKLNERVTISLSDGATLKLSPTELTPTDDNNQSIICALNWDDFGCLFLADALKDRLVEYAAEDQTTYDVVKLPHHGNYNKKLEEAGLGGSRL